MSTVLTMRVGCIGVGHMASAILSTILETRTIEPSRLTIFDPLPAQMTVYARQGVCIAGSPAEVVASSELILLAVKPQIMGEVLTQLGNPVGKCFISIAAGITTDFLRAGLPGAHVIRVMPNATLTVGCGATAIAEAPDVPSLYREAARTIFSCGGIVEEMSEDKLVSVVAVNGSSPAYFYQIVSQLASYGASQGIDPAAALRLAAKTMEGAARVLLQGEKSPAELVRMVATPGGTTQAAMDAMLDNGLEEAVTAGLEACTRRTAELSR